jgi:SAM-dependent methyltransferase
MSATAPLSERAAQWGRLWGSRALDWAASEEQQLPTYEEAIRRVGISGGQRVLDVGCGSGVFLRAAADLGADVYGIDASEALLELARQRVPEADLRLGDIEALPYDDDCFDVVAGFNSFFFAVDLVAALREAPDAPPEPELWAPGVLEEIATSAGSPRRTPSTSAGPSSMRTTTSSPAPCSRRRGSPISSDPRTSRRYDGRSSTSWLRSGRRRAATGSRTSSTS